MTTSAAETIDSVTGEVLAVRRPTSLVPSMPVRTLALEDCSDEEFDAHLARFERSRARLSRLIDVLLKPGVDFGTIAGVDKPVLAKSGSEKLLKAFDLVAVFFPEEILGDGVTSPTIRYRVRTEIHRGAADGPVVAEGWGGANSWEKKYRWRRGQRLCPACGKPAIIKGKDEYGGGWVCFKKKDGCGKKFADGDAAIEGQSIADIENTDPFDLDSNLLKQAKKRSQVDGTLTATATSERFTQDLEEHAAETIRAQRANEQATTESTIRPLLDRVMDLTDLAAFDAELFRMKPEADALDEATRAVLRQRLKNVREAIVKLGQQNSEARSAMERDGDPAPAEAPIVESAENAAKRAELAAAFREPGDDGPPPDEEAALALVEPCRLARTPAVLAKLWERVKATQSYTAATAEAKAIAQKNVDAIAAALRDEQAASRRGAQ